MRLLQPDLLVLQQALQDLGMMVNLSGAMSVWSSIRCSGQPGRRPGTGDARGAGRWADPVGAKRAVGEGTERWLAEFQLPAKQAEQPHIFSYALRNREAIWMGVPASYNLAELVTLPMRQLLGQGMSFIAPLLAGTREIGVLYADSRLSGRALKHEQFAAFQRFTQLDRALPGGAASADEKAARGLAVGEIC